MLSTSFQLRLTDSVSHGLVAVGKFDGVHSSLAYATAGGKVCIQSPQAFGELPRVQYLNINREITALAAGVLDTALGRDLLLIGTNSSLQAYDVHANQDLFFKDVSDGVSTLAAGQLGWQTAPAIVVGGVCSLFACDSLGNENYWTVTGGTVSALAFCNVNDRGQRGLLLGCSDYTIKMLQDESVVVEIAEADRIIGMTPLFGTKFAYALANGTIGVYDLGTRCWRVKSKHSVTAICSHVVDGSKQPDLVTAWSNGRIEVRKADNGQIMFKDNMTASIAAIVTGDYKGGGADQIIVCATSGEVRGYSPIDPDIAPSPQLLAANQALKLQELTTRKQELLSELQGYQVHRIPGAAGEPQTSYIIPPDTAIHTAIMADANKHSCSLQVSTSNDTVIRGVMLFAEQIFEGESSFHCPQDPSPAVDVPMGLKKDAAVTVLVQVLVSQQGSSVYHVFKSEVQLPKFCMYCPADPESLPPAVSTVRFSIAERPARVAKWISASFGGEDGVQQGPDGVYAHFVSLRTGLPLTISMQATQVTIQTEDIDLAGELVQDAAAYLGLTELASTASFPVLMQSFQTVLIKVQECNSNRMTMLAEAAEASNAVKVLVVKAEDARMLGEVAVARKLYTQLQHLNRELVMGHTKRATNHTELLDSLKLVNNMIQQAAKLRLGSPKSKVIEACRQAIKNSNTMSLLKIVQEGVT